MELPRKRSHNVNPKSYLNGKIYKVYNTVNDIIYIGSTTQVLPKRLHGHKADCLKQTSPFYTAMREIGVDCFKILLIELFSCTCKAELEAREYAIMNLHHKNKLYNARFDGKSSDETKLKLSISNKRANLGKFQSECPTFKRGSICDYQTKHSFCFRWGSQGIVHSTTFGYKCIRTRQTAYMMCVDLRNDIYPLTHIDYFKELPFYED